MRYTRKQTVVDFHYYVLNDTKPLIILYFVYIRTKPEYAGIIWNLLNELYKTSIERVQ